VKRSAGIYVRVSSDPEGLELGVERQEEDSRALAKRRGWGIVDVYRDNDISASGKRVRPDWERMLADVETGRIDAVVAYSSSRLYRNLRDLTKLIDLVEAHGADIGTCSSGDVVLDTADGRMMARILASVDQREWEVTSERRKRQNRQKREQAAAKGQTLRYAGRRRAFGYSPEGHVLNKKEAALLKDAARRIIGGTATVYRICMEWADAKPPVLTPYGGRWKPSKLARTLRGTHLLGTTDTPPIVTADEHELLMAALAINPRTGNLKVDKLGRPASPGRPSGRRYAALKLLRCGLCGSELTGRSGQYICGDCGKIGIAATMVEQYLVEHVFINARWGRASEPEPVADVEPILAQLRKLDARCAEVESAIEVGDMPAKSGGRILAKLDDQRIELQRQLGRTLPADTHEGPRLTWPPEGADYLTRWESRTLTDAEVATLQDFLRTFLRHVTVKPVGKGGRWLPLADRVDIVWRDGMNAADTG
jgi:site-specific DNA recombinase